MAGAASTVFREALRRADVRPGSRLAVALSGGPDSTALAVLASAWHREVDIMVA